MNRLKSATSPYLLQHADNPVDWWPWSDEAFAEARRRDVPVLLSVGYAACHWCHVMAHESFEDEATAALVNGSVVAIKVDREERPDIDAVYMSATQAMTGQGGWPMTVFMTPGRRAVPVRDVLPARPVRAAGDRGRGRLEAGQGQDPERVDSGSGRRWRSNAAAMSALGAGGELNLEDVTRHRGGRPGGTSTGRTPDSAARRSSRRRWRLSTCSATTSGPGAVARPGDGEATCEAMARGGMYDQLGGGFARYSVDASWTVPHFEKMLYDNALLAGVYTHLWRRTRDRPCRPPGGRRDLRLHAQGAAHARGRLRRLARRGQRRQRGHVLRLDPEQLREVLGEEDGEFAASVFGVTEAGTFEHGASVLQRLTDRRTTRAVRPDPRRPADGTGGAHPPSPRRQGGGRLERHGDRRHCRGRGAVRPPRPRWRPRRRRPGCSSPSTCASPRRSPRGRHVAPAAHLARTAWPGRAPGSSRTTPAWRPACLSCPG